MFVYQRVTHDSPKKRGFTSKKHVIYVIVWGPVFDQQNHVASGAFKLSAPNTTLQLKRLYEGGGSYGLIIHS
jgi:hypothetical protein